MAGALQTGFGRSRELILYLREVKGGRQGGFLFPKD